MVVRLNSNKIMKYPLSLQFHLIRLGEKFPICTAKIVLCSLTIFLNERSRSGLPPNLLSLCVLPYKNVHEIFLGHIFSQNQSVSYIYSVRGLSPYCHFFGRPRLVSADISPNTFSRTLLCTLLYELNLPRY